MQMQINIPTMGDSKEDPKNIKIQLPYDLGILLLGIFPKEIKSSC